MFTTVSQPASYSSFSFHGQSKDSSEPLTDLSSSSASIAAHIAEEKDKQYTFGGTVEVLTSGNFQAQDNHI